MGNGWECTLLSESKRQAGSGIVMGQHGSKYKSKVIPKDWHLVKVVGVLLGNEECPTPPCLGKFYTVMKFHDALNTIVMWPDSHIE